MHNTIHRAPFMLGQCKDRVINYRGTVNISLVGRVMAWPYRRFQGKYLKIDTLHAGRESAPWGEREDIVWWTVVICHTIVNRFSSGDSLWDARKQVGKSVLFNERAFLFLPFHRTMGSQQEGRIENPAANPKCELNIVETDPFKSWGCLSQICRHKAQSEHWYS